MVRSFKGQGSRFFWGLLVVGALLTASCRPSPLPIIPTPAPTPSPLPSPAATPLPPPKPQAADAEQTLAVEFAKAQLSLDREWERFRQTYKEWRQTDPGGQGMMTQSLNEFVARFQGVKGRVAELPLSPMVEGIGQKLIEAAEKEEMDLKSLRASWKPGEGSAFEGYEGERVRVDKLRREAASQLRDLIDASLPENAQAVDRYAKAQQLVQRDWDALHKEYDSWRKAEPQGDNETLEKFVADSQSILNSIYALPRPSQVRKTADQLVEAGEKEETALKQLQESWKPGEDSAFRTYERERLTVNKLRRDSRLGVEEALLAGQRENSALLEEFSSLYKEVSRSWEEFRADYDAWRNRGGDYNREAIAKKLTELMTSFGSLANRVYSLSRPAPIRPLAELLIEAAEKEEEALRQLRDSWKPYDPRYFQVFEGQWVEIDRLRRQAAAGVSELMRKYDITAAELGP